MDEIVNKTTALPKVKYKVEVLETLKKVVEVVAATMKLGRKLWICTIMTK